MFHAWGILTMFRRQAMRITAGKSQKAGLASGLCGDEVYYAFTRRS
jgi:hypothetical protein